MRRFRLVAAAALVALACSKGDEPERTTEPAGEPADQARPAGEPEPADEPGEVLPGSGEDAAEEPEPVPDPAPAGDPAGASGKVVEPGPGKGAAEAVDPKTAPPRNLKILPKKWSREQVDDYMEELNRGLGVECEFCHEKDDYAADSVDAKIVSRKMMVMTRDMNRQHFGGKDVLTCYTCHKGKAQP